MALSPKTVRGIGIAFLDGAISAVTAVLSLTGTGAIPNIEISGKTLGAIAIITVVGGGKSVVRYLQNSNETAIELPRDLPVTKTAAPAPVQAPAPAPGDGPSQL